MFLGVTHAEETEIAHLDEDLARHLARLLPGHAFWNHLVFDEAAHLVAQHAVFVAEKLGIMGLNSAHGELALDWIGEGLKAIRLNS